MLTDEHSLLSHKQKGFMKNELKIGDDTISFTVHAVERYITRVKPGLLRQEGLSDLLRLKDIAYIGKAPYWAAMTADNLLATNDSIDKWLHYGSDVAFPVIGNLAITCITKGGVSDQTRQKRNRHRVARNSYGKLSLDRRRQPAPRIEEFD